MAKKKTTGVAKHPNREDMKALWLQGRRAAYIVSWLEARCLPMVKRETIESYGRRYWNPLLDSTITVEMEIGEDESGSPYVSDTSGDEEDVSRAQELIAQVAESGLGQVKSIKIGSKEYPSWKREEGDEVAVSEMASSRMRTIEIVPAQSVGIQRVQRTEVSVDYTIQQGGRVKPAGWKLGVFLPDMQIGYFDNGKKLISTHDEAAIDVAHQMMAQAQEWYGLDVVINAGDNLDLPAFGSHRSAPGYMTTTQNALTRASEEAAIQRAIAPDAEISWIEGNHEQRLTNFLIDKAPQLLGLGRVPLEGEEEEEPVNSVPFLCRFDEYDVNWVGPHPDGEVWINDHLRFEHGRLYGSSPGTTAPKYLKDGVSVGFGHIHRSEMVQETRHTPRGPRTHFAGSPGCLCRLDSKVPSAKTGVDATGEQSGKRVENWQHGIWFFWYEETGRQFVRVDAVDIWGGWSMWEGIEFKATVDPNGDPVGS